MDYGPMDHRTTVRPPAQRGPMDHKAPRSERPYGPPNHSGTLEAMTSPHQEDYQERLQRFSKGKCLAQPNASQSVRQTSRALPAGGDALQDQAVAPQGQHGRVVVGGLIEQAGLPLAHPVVTWRRTGRSLTQYALPRHILLNNGYQ